MELPLPRDIGTSPLISRAGEGRKKKVRLPLMPNAAALLWRLPPLVSLLLLLTGNIIAATPTRTYDAAYRVELRPDSGMAHVTLTLAGPRLPSRLTFSVKDGRHRNFTSRSRLDMRDSTVAWHPEGTNAQLEFDFVVDHRVDSGRYDSRMTRDSALFRGDRLVPTVSVRAARSLEADTTLEFVLPKDWSVAAPYPETQDGRFRIEQPGRRFDRPVGWMLAGRIGTRQESIAGVHTTIAAPAGDEARRQDTLAFLNWNLPYLKRVFPEFPSRILVVLAGNPMFRGGLSGPGSLFLHSSLPLISENRTSTLLHELTHVALGIRGDEESDWIVEGLAEYYSLETLRRSGGIGERRFQEAVEDQGNWGRRAPNLFVNESSGATTARAVTVLAAVDREIREATGSKASLDDVARELARRRGTVSLALLQSLATKAAGRPITALDRVRLEAGR